ncbi:MAG TPA: HAMP domain-containing sensor histidine kinase [Candidatus Acidoferrales bacterium]|nr:HAMP domain-containing sensor histidine kinase [Candidatus Acidoferrales bacterium]
MRRLLRAFALPPAIAAAAGALLAWLIVGSVAFVMTQQAYRSTVQAARTIVRDELGSAGGDEVRAKLPELLVELRGWHVAATAFDRDGNYVAGNPYLRRFGRPIGNWTAAADGSSLIVPTRDGYVLVVLNPAAIWRARLLVAALLLATVVFAGAAAFFFARVWSRERAGSVARLRNAFDAVTTEAPAIAAEDDPIYGDVWRSASAAVDRLGSAISIRAQGEERLRSFLADAGHELRTPLAIAIGYLGILKRGALEDRALAERIVGDIGNEHERLQRLVERILDLARLDAIAMNATAVADVARVAEEAVALVRPLDPDRNFAVDASPGAYAAIDADDLRDALRNLLDNALRYALGASIAVRVRAGDDVTIEVADDGPGMDAFTAQHAFDRFFRGPERGSVTGSGLGLSIVRRIVERARGSVDLETRPGHGTTVRLRLPRARTAG